MRIAALILSAILAGCATVPASENDAIQVLTEEAAKAAVRHYFYDHPQPERIARFREVAKILIESEAVSTVEQFEAIALAEVGKTSDPLKREDAAGLVRSLAAVFRQYVGAGVLEQSAIVKVKGVIAALVDALPAG